MHILPFIPFTIDPLILPQLQAFYFPIDLFASNKPPMISA